MAGRFIVLALLWVVSRGGGADALYLSRAPRLTVFAAGKSTFKPYFSDDPVRWVNVFDGVAEKLAWEAPNGRYDDTQGSLSMAVNDLELESSGMNSSCMTSDSVPNEVLVLVGLTSTYLETVRSHLKEREYAAVCSFACEECYQSFDQYGSYQPGTPSLRDNFDAMVKPLFKTKHLKEKNVYLLAQTLWERRSTQDILFMLLLLVDSFTDAEVKSVQAATSSERTSLQSVKCMCNNCSKQMMDCFMNESCRKALACLDNCEANDQVCSYLCITSTGETKEFEAFAYCILQKHNCMNNAAAMPVMPKPTAITRFRDVPITHEAAEDILIGHLSRGEQQPSWKVVAGFNSAYDRFSDQHQLFYRDEKRPSIMWYDPVFKVETLEGKFTWRRRHYRVHRDRRDGPGHFRFTVLDNGVLSDEKWCIIDAADDLSWAVLFYHGVAAAAGTSYTGALIVTPSGHWPHPPGVELQPTLDHIKGVRREPAEDAAPECLVDQPDDTYARIDAALQKGGFKAWELFEVKQSESHHAPPPLGIP